MGPSAISALRDARMAGRYASGLRRFLRTPITQERARELLTRQEQTREQHFLTIVERHAFGRPDGPYFRLFRNAGIELGDVVKLLEQQGLEATLTTLLESGVYLRMEEFKGRSPISRPNFSLKADPGEFDNPWASPVFAASTSGSSGRSKRVLIGFEHMTREACYQALLRSAFGVEDRPAAMWRPVPPGSAGVSNALRDMKLGARLDRWFSQNPTGPSLSGLREYLFTGFTVAAGNAWGPGLPYPEYVPLSDAIKVARWLAECTGRGTPGLLNVPVSAAVRVCAAAKEAGLNISGSIIRVGGEPLTSARADLIRAAGCRPAPNYAMAEIGMLGLACAAPSGDDDVHLLTDKLAVIQRPHAWDSSGQAVGALVVTTLCTATPMVMINVDTGDYGVLDRNECGCEVGRLGFYCRLSGIRSYEKLTSEGMNFLEGDVAELIDVTLPSRFGGNPTDYQLVQNDRSGVSKVSVVVSPRLGEVSDQQVVDLVLRELAAGPRYKQMMAGIWEEGGTLEVLRREPYATSSAKVHPLHFIR